MKKMKEGKEKKALLVLFVFIVLLVVVEFTWVANMATPKKVFEISIDKIMDFFNELFQKISFIRKINIFCNIIIKNTPGIINLICPQQII